MSDREQELTLLINARNLAGTVVDGFGKSLGGIAKAAESSAARVGRAFGAVKNGVVNGLGNLTETLAQGGGVGPALFMFGAYMAGQAAEAFLETMIERLAESGLIAAIGAPISAAFSALGSLMSSAIAIGMAAFPVILAALIVGAIVFLINNPEIVGKIGEFALGVLKAIGDGLATLGKLLLGLFGKAWDLVVGAVKAYVTAVANFWLGLPGLLIGVGGAIVTTIINGLASFPGKLADVVRRAFEGLDLRVGPFHITGHGITIELPNITVPAGVGGNAFSGLGGKAAGGYVGLRGPELTRTGETGREFVLNNRLTRMLEGAGDAAGGGTTLRLEGVSEAQIVDMVDRGLFFRLRRAPATGGRI